MKKAMLVMVTVAAFGMVLAGASPASASTNPQTLRLVDRSLQFNFVDNAPPGPSIGDEFTFKNAEYSVSGHRVGTVTVHCVSVSQSDRWFMCTGVASLPNGTLSFQGLIGNDPSATIYLAITGGTGAYSGASGQIRVVPVTPDVAHITIFLL